MIFVGVDLFENLGITAWGALLAPSVALSLFCASFYLVSLGVRDVAHPRRSGASRASYGTEVGEAG